ncbi:hypothetical protein K9F62_02275 [Desulfovibrio sp. JY]|nr:hypothetical protein K9F62_02275 [Desulfovibrio sp. JY]
MEIFSAKPSRALKPKVEAGGSGCQRQKVLKIISTISTTSTGRPTPAKSEVAKNLAYQRRIDDNKKFS